MTRTPLLLGLLAVFILASMGLSACTPKPTVNEATPESESRFEMVNGVLMRVNELPSKAETQKKLEFENIRHRVIDQEGQNRDDKTSR